MGMLEGNEIDAETMLNESDEWILCKLFGKSIKVKRMSDLNQTLSCIEVNDKTNATNTNYLFF